MGHQRRTPAGVNTLPSRLTVTSDYCREQTASDKSHDVIISVQGVARKTTAQLILAHAQMAPSAGLFPTNNERFVYNKLNIYVMQ